MIALALYLTASQLNPAVTQQTLSVTICAPHYATTYRKHHPIHVKPRKGFIRDHIVPIELGGSSAASNIQLQSKADAARKDRLENALRKAVCQGSVSLRDAQLRMEAWR